jgi:hypothetical protein
VPVGRLNVASIQRSCLLPEGTSLVKTLVRLRPGESTESWVRLSGPALPCRQPVSVNGVHEF